MTGSRGVASVRVAYQNSSPLQWRFFEGRVFIFIVCASATARFAQKVPFKPARGAIFFQKMALKLVSGLFFACRRRED
jgi:hypothetical protein